MGNQRSSIHTHLAKSTQNNNDIIPITVNTKESIISDRYQEKFVVHSLYTKQEKVKNTLNQIEKYLNQKYEPIKIKISHIYDGFTGKQYNIESVSSLSLTHYIKNDIIKKGLNVYVENMYQHKVLNCHIDCKFMTNQQSKNPLVCPIYYNMIQNCEFSEENYNHLLDAVHFSSAYEQKPACKYKQNCSTYIRQQNNIENTFDDKCHMILFRHPPRIRNIKLHENINSLIINKRKIENHPLYKPTDQHEIGYLNALIDEVIKNGYKTDLCLTCGIYDDCKHEKYSILQIVDEKMKHKRHKAMGSPLRKHHMLALFLYTSCECNYDLCNSQRSSDYAKWKWFDYCLYSAISELSQKEIGSYNVYSGLHKVKANKKQLHDSYLVTYTSASWKKEVAEAFMKNDGVMIEIDKDYRNLVACCDVSWISKFPDECEILFARSIAVNNSAT
eukprot:465871_1